MKCIKLWPFYALFAVMFGCSVIEYAPYPIHPGFYIEYVDKEGNPVMSEEELKELYEKGERILEVLSVTDDKGVSIEFRYGFCACLRTSIFDKLDTRSPKMERQYTVKYKVPRILGESIEELNLILSVDGYSSKFTKASYNGNELPYNGGKVKYRGFDTIHLILPVEKRE
jgi:hypothetical protein